MQHGHLHVAVLRFVLVERALAEAMLPAYLRSRHTGFLFLSHPDDLRLGETALSHLFAPSKGSANSTSQGGKFRGAGHRPRADLRHVGQFYRCSLHFPLYGERGIGKYQEDNSSFNAAYAQVLYSFEQSCKYWCGSISASAMLLGTVNLI